MVACDGLTIACAFTHPSFGSNDTIYLGRLANSAGHRGKGHGQRLIHAAEDEASAAVNSRLTHDTGCALTELHRSATVVGYVLQPDTGVAVTFLKDLG